MAAEREHVVSEQADAHEPRELEIGERVQVVVTGITHYGVFAAAREGQRGLIHISEISDWFVENARDYFYVGEEVAVEVIDREERTGKYAFSTRRLGGKKPVAEAYARKLLRFHEGDDVEGDDETPAAGEENGELGEILAFLRERVGDVTGDARRELAQLVAKHGSVRVALAVADVTKRFDRSLALVNWVGRQLDRP